MTKSASTTTEQLRRLMQNHVGNSTPPSTAVAARVAPITPTSTPPPVPLPPVVAAPEVQKVTTRYSLRLLASEIAKVNSIIQKTLEVTGERITFTDVLRVGLGRINFLTAMSKAEILALRRFDGRRHLG